MKELKQIRQAVKAALVGKTRATDRVESSRPNPLSQRPTALGGREELPAIIIYTPSTKSEIFDESPRRYKHTSEVRVECALEVAADQDIDDSLDDFEQEVLDVLLLDDTVDGLVDDIAFTGSTNTVEGTGAKLLAAVIMSFEVTFYTYAPVEGTQEMDDFATFHTEHSLAGAQPDTRDRAITHVEDLEQ